MTTKEYRFVAKETLLYTCILVPVDSFYGIEND